MVKILLKRNRTAVAMYNFVTTALADISVWKQKGWKCWICLCCDLHVFLFVCLLRLKPIGYQWP